MPRSALALVREADEEFSEVPDYPEDLTHRLMNGESVIGWRNNRVIFMRDDTPWEPERKSCPVAPWESEDWCECL